MGAIDKKQLRDIIRESYNNAAQERGTSATQDWKIQVRANYYSLLQHEQKRTILEIGAGVGRDSKFFQDQGLETVAIDLSPAMVELCRQKGLTAHVMDIGEIQFPNASFDAVYAMNSLLHLPKAEFPGVLRTVERLLTPNGLFFLGVYGGYDHEGIWEGDAYAPQRFFSFFTDDHLKQEAGKVFDIHSFDRVDFGPEDPIHFQSLILRKCNTA